jgi:hypothetical protein
MDKISRKLIPTHQYNKVIIIFKACEKYGVLFINTIKIDICYTLFSDFLLSLFLDVTLSIHF